LLDEVRAALPALQRIATATAGEDGVRRVIAKRFELYPQPQRSDEQWAAWWADYYDALADVPLASLEAGMRAYVADPESEFMPKPGRLRELAFTAPCRSLRRYQRAKRALQMAEEVPAVSGPKVEAGEVRALLAEFEQKSLSIVPKRDMPSTAGKPDEGGLTPQMRALLARRAAR
jgi:hypothetical protein